MEGFRTLRFPAYGIDPQAILLQKEKERRKALKRKRWEKNQAENGSTASNKKQRTANAAAVTAQAGKGKSKKS